MTLLVMFWAISRLLTECVHVRVKWTMALPVDDGKCAVLRVRPLTHALDVVLHEGLTREVVDGDA
jgi:hypothetical protein